METKRIAFKMKLKDGFEAEYKRRHDEIWPELVKLIKDSGISDYSIFLDRETNILFACQKQTGNLPNLENGNNPVVRKWWDYMADIMEVNPDNSAVEHPLFEVFYLP
jgi:L-rhamnose mutarotase